MNKPMKRRMQGQQYKYNSCLKFWSFVLSRPEQSQGLLYKHHHIKIGIEQVFLVQNLSIRPKTLFTDLNFFLVYLDETHYTPKADQKPQKDEVDHGVT